VPWLRLVTVSLVVPPDFMVILMALWLPIAEPFTLEEVTLTLPKSASGSTPVLGEGASHYGGEEERPTGRSFHCRFRCAAGDRGAEQPVRYAGGDGRRYGGLDAPRA
jgi:hypothetical protein